MLIGSNRRRYFRGTGIPELLQMFERSHAGIFANPRRLHFYICFGNHTARLSASYWLARTSFNAV